MRTFPGILIYERRIARGKRFVVQSAIKFVESASTIPACWQLKTPTAKKKMVRTPSLAPRPWRCAMLNLTRSGVNVYMQPSEFGVSLQMKPIQSSG